MRKAFTLIELLVVLAIVVLVVGVVVPKGWKMLDLYQKQIDKTVQLKEVYRLRADAFLSLKEQNITIENHKYIISIRGVIVEISDDDY